MIKKIRQKLEGYWHKRTGKAYINYLRKKGIKIGESVFIRKDTLLDISRPALLEIGNNVRFGHNFRLFTHDFASVVFLPKYKDFVMSSGRVKIGNNVYFGVNCTVLKGVTIGDNVIVGAGSMVIKNIPSNSVVSGSPARIICDLDTYYAKRKTQYIEEILDYARSIQERFGRKPLVEEFYDDYPAFVDGSNYEQYDFPYYRVFNEEQFENWKQNHKAPFKSFDEFLKAAGIE